MKHIGIVGSFGSGNYGDEAAWIAVKQFLESKNPAYKYHTHIFYWSTPFIVAGHRNYGFYNFSVDELKWINENFSAMIITGGGIIGHTWGLTKVQDLRKTLTELKIPIYCISISAEDGEYDEVTKQNIRYLQKRSRIFTVRDNHSKNVLKKMGIEVEVTPDVVTILKPNQQGTAHPINKKIVGVMYCNDMTAEYIEFWRKIYKEFTPNIEYIPSSLLPIDIQGTQLITGRIRYESYTPFEVLELFKNASFVLGGKLHACLFSAIMKTPFFGYNYHPKVKCFCDSINYPYFYPKGGGYSLDRTDYGYDIKNFNVDELIEEIKNSIRNPIIPEIKKDAKDILERMWRDLTWHL